MGRLKSYLKGLSARDFRSAIRERTALPPWKVKLKLTTRCNLRCAKCNYWRDGRKESLTDELARRVVTQAAKLGARSIKFSGGEVTLREDLPALIRTAKRRGMDASITTNGTMMDRGLAKHLVKAGIDQVNISLDSANEAVHDRLVGVEGAWRKTVDAFHQLLSRRSNGRPRLVLQTMVCRENIGDLRSLAGLAREAGADSLSLLGFVPFHLAEETLEPAPAAVADFLAAELGEVENYCLENGISLANNAYTEECLASDPYFTRHACYIPWIGLMIAADGYVYPCCFAKQRKYRLGNVARDKLAAIIDGPLYRGFREKTAPVCTEEVCRRCRTEIRTNQHIDRWLACGD